MNISVQFHDQAFPDAIEIHDEAVQDMLAPDLESEHTTVAKERPRVPLGRRRVQPELACKGELLSR
ncbi:MAG TPA: hypothetical protein VK467_00255 [Gemmatimonadales bacterium]|nr:hypothetical protein [Gemmatimonadales bacterium]